MDGLFKKGKEMLSGNKSTTGTGGQTAGQGQKQDYGDKAINAVQAKFGIDKDGKYDKYEEKGSDFFRGQAEKKSGKDIPDKFSN